MSDNDEIIRLLTDIRNLAADEAMSRKKVVEESIRLQRIATRRQMLAIIVGIGLTIVAILAVFIMFGSSYEQEKKSVEPHIAKPVVRPD
jgi:hypothetical protein